MGEALVSGLIGSSTLLVGGALGAHWRPRTGSATPGAVGLRGGDVLGCRIEGFEPPKNPVRRC